MRPRFCVYLSPKEGVGNAGCPLHPRLRVHLVVVERTRVNNEYPGITRRSRTQWFLRLFRAPPAIGLFCHRRLRIEGFVQPG